MRVQARTPRPLMRPEDVQPGAYLHDETRLWEVVMLTTDGNRATIENCVTGARRLCGITWLSMNMHLVRAVDHDIPVAA